MFSGLVGEVKIAAIYSSTSNVNYGLFTEAAINLVNQGYWDPNFPGKSTITCKFKGHYCFIFVLHVALGRTASCDYYWVQTNDPQEILNVYDTIRAQNLVGLQCMYICRYVCIAVV